MPAPTATAALNQSTFAPGDAMILTVTYGDPDDSTGTISVVVTDAAGNTSEPVVLPYSIVDPGAVAVTDSAGRVFDKTSDDGSTAVFRATA